MEPLKSNKKTNRKKIIPPLLITLFALGGFTRIEGAGEIKSILFVSVLVIGIGFGILVKNIWEIYSKPN